MTKTQSFQRLELLLMSLESPQFLGPCWFLNPPKPEATSEFLSESLPEL